MEVSKVSNYLNLMYYNGFGTSLHQACMDFWKSNSNIGMDKMEDCEGLTNCSAQVVEIRQAKISRGKGLQLLI